MLTKIKSILFVVIGIIIFSITFQSEAFANFTDVKAYEKEINYLSEKGIINGYSDGTFKPSNNITRAQAARMFMREIKPNLKFKQEIDFTDIKPNHSDYETIQNVITLKVFSGKTKKDGSSYFDPSGKLTRAQFAKIFVEAYDLYRVEGNSQSFKDISKDTWYKEYVEILASHGLITGYGDGTFKPNEPIKRSHFSAIYYRYLTNDSLYHRELSFSGTALDAQQRPIINQTINFESAQGKVFTVETDRKGHFETRLRSKETYTINTSKLKGKFTFKDSKMIENEFETGSIAFGTTLSNDENLIVLNASARLLSDDTKIIQLNEQFTKVVLQTTQEYVVGDIFLIEQHELAPSGVALRILSLEKKDGLVYLTTEQPDIEDVYSRIKGTFQGEIDPNTIELEEGATLVSNSVAALNPNPIKNPKYIKVEFDKFTFKNVDLKPTLSFTASMDLKIDWAWEWDLLDSLNAEFKGVMTTDLKVSKAKNAQKNCKKPLKEIAKNCVLPLSKKDMTIPTTIPGVTIGVLPYVGVKPTVAADFTTSLTTTMVSGINYNDTDRVTLYPDDKITHTFSMNELSGSAKISIFAGADVQIEGAKATIISSQIEGGLEAEAKVHANAILSSISLDGIDGAVGACASVTAKPFIEGKISVPLIKFTKPVFKVGETLKPFKSFTVGPCINEIIASPSAIQLAPGETKNIYANLLVNKSQKNLLLTMDQKHIQYSSTNKSIATAESKQSYIAVTAPKNAQDGATATITITAPGSFGTLKEEIEVEIFDAKKRGELVGKVVDAVSGEPIKNASIKAYKGDEKIANVSTDDDGQYSIKLAKGEYDLVISKTAYLSDRSTVEILEAEKTYYDSTLKLILDELLGKGKVKGQGINSLTGKGIPDLTLNILKGRNVKGDGNRVATVTTDKNGYYEIELEPGYYTLVVVSEDYNGARENILSVPRYTNTEQNITALPIRSLKEADLEVILTWGQQPWDLDSHFKGTTALGESFHVYYSRKKFTTSTGMKVELDVDDRHSYGPETVTVINNLDDGEYEYFVNNFSRSPDIKTSEAVVRVYQNQKLIRVYNVPLKGEGYDWRVFKITNGVLEDLNYIE